MEAPDRISTRWAGVVDNVDRFDAAFFGISRREAEYMDPQQRLLLETAWDAIERGGQAGVAAHARTGVFVGVSNNDYLHLQADRPISERYLETGNRNAFAAGRLSHPLDLRGPSMAIDTLCSSSLVAVHTACRSLESRDCDLALAGGVNLMLAPIASVMASRWGMLAPDGR